MNAPNLVLIPNKLIQARDMDSLEDWMLNWKPSTSATMREEIRAANALHVERFVRHNVSHKKYLEWMQENPRNFTTERELEYLASRSAPQSS
jgi:hypothetical protein